MNKLLDFKREKGKSFSEIVNSYSYKHKLNPIGVSFNSDEDTLYVIFEPIIKYDGN